MRRVGALLPARVAALPALGHRADPRRFRALAAVDVVGRMAGPPCQPAVGAVPRQRSRRRAAGDGTLLLAGGAAAPRAVRPGQSGRTRGGMVAGAPRAPARRARGERRSWSTHWHRCTPTSTAWRPRT